VNTPPTDVTYSSLALYEQGNSHSSKESEPFAFKTLWST
jgi:hypothetical protein